MVDQKISKTAATHDADKIGGGNIWGLTRLGDSGINSSIGSQWNTKQLADQLENAVQAFIASPDYINASPENQKLAMLNVKLKMALG
ncbi:MAG: hypothetical protein HC815_32490 [Richelia sp. RM1_1_1]|nr:hypothetical protein [Richelia sp. RM1_1_1]